MIYLALAIIASASIALIFKFSEGRGMDRYVVTNFNYLAASLISLIIIIINDIRFPFISFSINWSDLNSLFPLAGKFTDANGSLIWAMVIGIPTGFLFFISFIYYQKGINENGAGLAGAFSKIGILIPMSISIVLWNEIPTMLQSIGISISIISILLVNVSFERFDPDKLRLTLLALFLFTGLAEFSNKVFQKYALVEYKLVFLFFVFFTAFLISAVFLLGKKGIPDIKTALTGIVVGLPNLFCSYFLILALDGIKASVVFPVYTATTIVLINIGSFLLFKERLKKKERASIFMMVIALVLINLS